jgi:hypothetical protein
MRGETIQNNFIVLLIGTVTLLFSLMVKFSQNIQKIHWRLLESTTKKVGVGGDNREKGKLRVSAVPFSVVYIHGLF